MKIKHLKYRDIVGTTYEFYGTMGTIAIIVLTVYEHRYHTAFSLMETAILASVIIVVLWFMLVAIFLGHRRRERLNYEKRLSRSPLVLLIKATISQELDRNSKKMITYFLNDHYPGWSLK